MTQEKFISKVKAIYGDKYDLSKVVYKGVKNEVILIDKCAKKEIVVKPEKILHKQYIRLTNEERANIFIKKSKEKFGDKFDYSKVKYINSNTPVTLVCKEHGEFDVDMYKHLCSKDGLCPLCNKIAINKEKADAFIKKSKDKFGDKFDYSKTKYVDSKTPVTLICKEHGEFNVNMYTHLYSKDGLCPFCNESTAKKYGRGGRKQLSTEYLIKKCQYFYGDKYDYSKVEYKGGNAITEKIEIVCPTHGSFLKCVDNINKRDCGCPKCSKEKKRLNGIVSNAKKFIERSKNKFGDRFDYSEVKYVNAQTPITLICKEHGTRFSTIPNVHLNSRFGGCKECHKRYIESHKRYIESLKNLNKPKKPKLTEEERKKRKIECLKNNFIKKAINKFGNRYDYSEVKYINGNTLVNIIDKELNNEIFSIKPHNFFQSKNGRPDKIHITTEKFIEMSKKVHGNKYDYSKVDYKADKIKVCIICPKHGEFWQTPHNHLNSIRNGCGCPKCANAVSKLEEEIINRLTEENIKFKNQYTNKDIFGKMRGDFFIESYNVMIECQGSQHFMESNPFHESYGGSLSGQIKRDYNFNKCCKDANIKLFYYFDEDNTKGADYLNDEKFNGIYTEKNTFTNIDSLISCIKNA